jgi:hypothetical protein
MNLHAPKNAFRDADAHEAASVRGSDYTDV